MKNGSESTTPAPTSRFRLDSQPRRASFPAQSGVFVAVRAAFGHQAAATTAAAGSNRRMRTRL